MSGKVRLPPYGRKIKLTPLKSKARERGKGLILFTLVIRIRYTLRVKEGGFQTNGSHSYDRVADPLPCSGSGLREEMGLLRTKTAGQGS